MSDLVLILSNEELDQIPSFYENLGRFSIITLTYVLIQKSVLLAVIFAIKLDQSLIFNNRIDIKFYLFYLSLFLRMVIRDSYVIFIYFIIHSRNPNWMVSEYSAIISLLVAGFLHFYVEMNIWFILPIIVIILVLMKEYYCKIIAFIIILVIAYLDYFIAQSLSNKII